MRQIEDKIDTLIKDKQKLLEYNRPVTAFISFVSEEGLNRAADYNDIVKHSPALKEKGFDKLLN